MYDIDASGSLDAYEFVIMCRSLMDFYTSDGDGSDGAKIFSDRQVAKFFRTVDKDSSGTISDEELFEAIRGNPSPHRQACIDYMFSLIDTDGDGCIDFAEAVAFYGNHKLNVGELGKGEEGSSKGVRRKTQNATARKFIDHFDRRAQTAGTIDVAAEDGGAAARKSAATKAANKASGKGEARKSDHVQRDGHISMKEFQLYWANRSFYIESDEQMHREMTVDFGVNLESDEAKAFLFTKQKAYEEMLRVQTLGQDGATVAAAAVAVVAGDEIRPLATTATTASTATTSISPSIPVQAMPSGKSPLKHRASVVANDVAEMVGRLNKMSELLAANKTQWQADVTARDKTIASQAKLIAELQAKNDELELQAAL
jgi:hypothetical protein